MTWSNKKARWCLLLLLLPAMFVGQVSAQEETEEEARTRQKAYYKEEVEARPFDEKAWEDATKELDYSRYEEEEEEKPPKPEEKPKEKKSDPSTPFFGGAIFQVLFFAAILLILGFVLWKIFGNSALLSNEKIAQKAGFTLDEIEDNLPDSDVDRALEEALAAGNYHLAIRLQFLAVLKELSLGNHIRWKKDKTNGDYLYELTASKFYPAFGELVYLFEVVWYGEVKLTEAEFKQLQPQFQQFIAELAKSPSA